MGSYTPLDLDRFKSQSDSSSQSVTTEQSTSVSSSGPRRFSNPAIPYMLITSFVVALISGVFYMQLMFQNNLRTSEGQETKNLVPQTANILKIATDATFPPMEFKDDAGQLHGYGVELGQKLAEAMNMQVDIQDVSWDNIFTSLEEGKVDMIISSVTITDERKLKYDFSDPYLNAGQVIVTQKSNTTIKSPQDLADKKIGAQAGTTNEDQAKLLTSPDKVVSYNDFIHAGKDLADGNVDAVIADLPGAKGIIDENPDLKIASDPFTEEYYGIVFRKDQEELRQKVNAALDSLRQKGILSNLKEKWLN